MNYPFPVTQQMHPGHGYMSTSASLPTTMPSASINTITPGQSAPWTEEDDRTLLDAKSKGLGWNDIHMRYFPGKSGNACRKRYERVIQKAKQTNWTDERVRMVMATYDQPSNREAFWTKIAQQVGESNWEEVERVVCLILTASRQSLTSR
jgi:hypothetical protein